MKLFDVGMVAVSSPRTKAYLELLINNDLFLSHIIILEDPTKKLMPGQLSGDDELKQTNPYFNINRSLLAMINKHKISFEIIFNKDINGPELVNVLKKRPEQIFIYSGAGGAILKKEILGCGKDFLHIHPGRVPDFKGSTTIYYSILAEGNCFASAFFLDKEIDKGPLIKIREFPMPSDGTIIDYAYDPYVRASLLVDVLKDYSKKGKTLTTPQDKGGETFFIIHPVLKHIAILSCK